MMDEDKPKHFDPDAVSVDDEISEDAKDDVFAFAATVNSTDGQSNDSEPKVSASGYESLDSLGGDLARAMQEEGYHPVVLFGTNNSGKTSILMSLFATLANESVLETGLSLCDPILGTRTTVGRQLHKEAKHTFEVKTEAFLIGEKIPKTSTPLPFFVPVEFRPPDGRPTVKFAFLESNGEWYRPLISDGRKLSDTEQLYPELRGEIESFISNFQNGISFIYTAPVTQGEVYAAAENAFDATEIRYASLAIKGVLKSYDRIRANGRGQDKHLMLLTKWDAQSARSADRAAGIEEDSAEVADFCRRRYGQALTAFQGLNLDSGQRNINAYCAGMINAGGLLPLKTDAEVKSVIDSYPVRLWSYLYSNALQAAGEEPVSPFREPPARPIWSRLLDKFLDRVSS